jgi:hypothetical protein
MTPRLSTPATSQKSQSAQPEGRGEPTHLSHRYGTIGIQAVAAAARYADRRKSPAQEPATGLRIDLRFVESAG